MTIATHNTDCIAWLRDQPDGAFDVCLTDPPYDERTHAGARTNKRRIDPFINEIDFAPLDPATIVSELIRVTRRWVVCFCALQQLGEYQQAAGDAYVRGGVMVKNNPMPQITGDRPATGAEGFAILHSPGRKRWNFGGKPALIFCNSGLHDKQALGLTHPTVKPLEAMRWLVDAFTEPGETVLDPFMGSGTTGVACIERGRSFVGIERDPRYYGEALQRLAAAKAQPPLFAPEPKAKQGRMILE